MQVALTQNFYPKTEPCARMHAEKRTDTTKDTRVNHWSIEYLNTFERLPSVKEFLP